MGVAILLMICVGLVMQRKLSAFWEAGNLPYAQGFIMYVWVFSILNFVNFIWLFGVSIGITLALLTFFQVIYSSFLWPFSVPGMIKQLRRTEFETFLFGNEPSPLLQGGWSFLIVGLLILTIINFFVSSYASFSETVLEGVDMKALSAFLIVAIVLGNILRVVTIKVLSKMLIR